MKRGRAPGFWWRAPGWEAAMLAPAAALYGAVADRRLANAPRVPIDAPVICVGNPTAGGGGKTPTVLALAAAAAALGRRPGILARGHGGSAEGPLLVDPARHDAVLTGDEPLLLAERAPTVVDTDRARGAALLLQEGCDLVLMDDGFQSARLHPDLALLVLDGARGLGNRRVLPAGPLRAPLARQFAHANAVLLVGPGEVGQAAAHEASRAGLSVHHARIAVRDGERFQGRAVLAFAGIADPGKFYRSLAEIGAAPAERRDFPDHHPFTAGEIARIRDEARERGLTPATTAKDAVRLRASAEGRALLAETLVLGIELVLGADGDRSLVAGAIAAYEGRRPARRSASSAAAASR